MSRRFARGGGRRWSRVGAASAFDPGSLVTEATLIYGWEADAAGANTTIAGGNPTVLKDVFSGLGNDFVAGGAASTCAALQATRWGYDASPTLYFDGGAHWYKSTGLAPYFSGNDKLWTVILVGQFTNNSAATIFGGGSTSGPTPNFSVDVSTQAGLALRFTMWRQGDAGGGSSAIIGATSETNLAPGITAFQYSGTQIRSRRDGVNSSWATRDTGVMTIDAVVLGAFYYNGGVAAPYLRAAIKAIYVFNGVVDASMPALEAALAARYGVSKTTLGATVDTTEDVYAIAGQSNASGRGTGTYVGTQPNVRALGNDYFVHSPATEPLDNPTAYPLPDPPAGGDAGCGVSPWLHMADVIRASSGNRILLVPCALGGTTSTQWLPANGSGLYVTMIDRLREALRRPSAAMKRLLVWQGENNATTALLAASWQADWATIIATVRADLSLPTLKVVVVKLPPTVPLPNVSYPNWSDVRAAQQALADADPNIQLVQAPDGPFDATLVHLETGVDSGATRTGVLGVGRLAAEAVLTG